MARQRLQTLAHVTFHAAPPDAMPGYPWPPYRQWSWLLASATAVAANPPDPGDAEILAAEILDDPGRHPDTRARAAAVATGLGWT